MRLIFIIAITTLLLSTVYQTGTVLQPQPRSLHTNTSPNKAFYNTESQIYSNTPTTSPANTLNDSQASLVTSILAQIEPATVKAVIDGDTIIVSTDRQDHRLRYIGINTPEYKTAPCLAGISTRLNKQLVLHKQVLIAKDTRETDRYGRLLRYVFVKVEDIDDPYLKNVVSISNAKYKYKETEYLFINQFLVEQGYADVMTVPPDTKFADLFRKLHKQAKEHQKGLYAPNVCNQPALNPPTSSPQHLPNTFNATPTNLCAGVICSYNAYNCANFNTYQEAYYVFRCCLQRTGKDIHHLDGDKDGIPCEHLR